MYPVVVEVDFEAEDEIMLTAFINHLIQFRCDKIRVRRIYPAERGGGHVKEEKKEFR